MELTKAETNLITTLRNVIADPTEKFITVHATPFLSPNGEYHHIIKVLPSKTVPRANAPSGLITMFEEMKKGLGVSQSLWLVFYDAGVLSLFKSQSQVD